MIKAEAIAACQRVYEASSVRYDDALYGVIERRFMSFFTAGSHMVTAAFRIKHLAMRGRLLLE